MFHSARIKLTFWYLVIIMTVSISFSALIYRGVSIELERRLNTIQSRLELRRLVVFPNQPYDQEINMFIDDLQDSRQRVQIILMYINLVILIFSALAGYFLAGKTLRPIEFALEEQKRFIADASHEFKTPLTSLQTSIEVALRDKKMTLKDAKFVLQESLSDIHNLSNLSHYLLGLARYQKDNSLMKEKIQLDVLIKNCVNKINPLAISKNIKVTTNLVPIKIMANSESMEKLINILLDNAIKYSTSGKTIYTGLSKKSKFAVISVKDQGIGISQKDITHIFERFYRADISRSKDIAGFGLGLSMAKQITDLHKGEINVTSKINEGSVFTVRLPLSI
jgi:two-component system, OmpR family, sensor histidine kinase CiaH